MTSPTPCIETVKLTRLFGPVRVTGDVDFALYPGERRALIGPNGAGKTTLVNLLCGRLKPSSGRILLNGVDVSNLSEAKRCRLGLGRTFQITSLFPRLSVRQNLFLAVSEHEGLAWRLFRPAFGHVEQMERVDELLHRIGLADAAEIPVSELAYGRQRLLEIGLALALRPRIILFDEPAAGIPTAERHGILRILASIPKEIAILLIDHDMDLVFKFARKITVLVQGGILVEGTPAEIAADERVRNVYLGEGAQGGHAAA